MSDPVSVKEIQGAQQRDGCQTDFLDIELLTGRPFDVLEQVLAQRLEHEASVSLPVSVEIEHAFWLTDALTTHRLALWICGYGLPQHRLLPAGYELYADFEDFVNVGPIGRTVSLCHLGRHRGPRVCVLVFFTKPSC